MTDSPVHPADFLNHYLVDKGIKQRDFAAKLGVSQGFLSMLLNKQRRLTETVITGLGKFTDYPGSDWLKMQHEYDDWNRIADLPENKHSNAPSRGGVLARREILSSVNEGVIEITPFVPDNVMGASFDLTLGETQKFKPRDQSNAPREERANWVSAAREKVILKPGETWKAWCHESVKMPSTMCGRLGGMSEFILHGIIVGTGLQIDPGWSGHPFVFLNHVGDEEFELFLKKPFLSLEVSLLTSDASETG
jgi:plasmid maintenance system antidote protein VapI/deoxycytidine triphosphate deaminase